tara:strand:- start:157 stop:669 length:513 start_codon:yes stop_codon:yes gene_type:complete
VKHLLENWRQFLNESKNAVPLFKKAKIKPYIDLGLFAEGDEMIFGAVCVIFDQESGHVLIVKRPKEDRWMPSKWALVGGKLDKGETSLEAVVREVKEETQIDIESPKFFYTSQNGEVEYFWTQVVNPKVVIDFEHDDYAWVDPKELTNYDIVPGLERVVLLAQKELYNNE